MLTVAAGIVRSPASSWVITGVFPYTGPVSSVVTIKGGNFDPLPANDTVFFGGVKAYVSSATANYLTVSVPVGAVYAPINVTSKGLTVYSNAFIPVYTGGGSVDSNSFAKPDSFLIGTHPLALAAMDFDGDPAQPKAVNYYRLKIEDTVGKVSFSPIVRVALPVAPELVMIFPNPANDMITATVPVTTNNSGFELVDMMGQIVLSVPVKAGVAQVTIYIRTLNRGVYKLMWSDGVNKAFGELLVIRR